MRDLVVRFVTVVCVGWLVPAFAEDAAAPPAQTAPPNLEEIVGPIALYPDDLLAIVLPASTFPLQIRWSRVSDTASVE